MLHTNSVNEVVISNKRNIFIKEKQLLLGDIMTDNRIDLSLYPRWSDSCIWRPQNDGLFVVRITERAGEQTEQSDAVFHTVEHIILNREGKETWMLCTGEHTVDTIVKTLQEEYEEDEQAIQKDVVEMIARTAEKNYISLEQSPRKADRGMDGNAYPKRKDDVVANAVEDNFVIMNMKTSEIHSFDQPIENLWDICDGTHTVGEILSTAANTDETQFLLEFLLKLDLLELKDEKMQKNEVI